MNTIEIITYATKTGKEPFTEWSRQLDKPVRAAIIRRLERVALGNFGDTKQIQGSNGIWELRIDFGPGYRVYFAKDGKKIVLLLTGGSKRSQTRDIAKAKQYWLEYEDSL